MDSRNRLYDVVISATAKDMFVQHMLHLTHRSPQKAESLRGKLLEAMQTLESFPLRHPWLSDPMIATFKYRKMVVDKRYLLIYQVRESTVYVDAVVNCRQDYKWLLY